MFKHNTKNINKYLFDTNKTIIQKQNKKNKKQMIT